MQERSAAGAMDVVALITVFAQGSRVIAGVVVPPDAFATMGADDGFILQTAGAEVLPVKVGSQCDRMPLAADFADKGFCGHVYFLLEFF